MDFKHLPDRAMRIGFGSKIPIKFIGTDVIQDSFEESVYQQASRVANLPHISFLAFMPDAHLGIGTCIGTMAMWEEKDALVSPSVVGVDIGCGMRLVRTPLTAKDFARETLRTLMLAIEARIPMGAGKKVENPLVTDFNVQSAILWKDSEIANRVGLSEDTFLGNVVPGSFTYLDYLHYVPEISERAWQRGFDTLGTLGGGKAVASLL